MFLAKLSILLLYLRIFQVDRLTRVLVYIALIWNAMLALAIMIGFGILCVPPPGQSWQLASQDHKCSVVSVLFSQITGAINVCSDLFIIGIPIPAVWNLQLRTSKKFGVIAIFAAGGLQVFFPKLASEAVLIAKFRACLASLLSLVYRVKQYRVGDKTWTSATAYLLTWVNPTRRTIIRNWCWTRAAEIDVGIMCSCMPSYTHYLRHLIDFFRSLRSAALRAKPAESNPFKRPSKLRFNRFNLQLVSDIEKTIESTARDDGDSNCHPSNTLWREFVAGWNNRRYRLNGMIDKSGPWNQNAMRKTYAWTWAWNDGKPLFFSNKNCMRRKLSLLHPLDRSACQSFLFFFSLSRVLFFRRLMKSRIWAGLFHSVCVY